MQLAEVLPDGWRLRVRVAFSGASLTLTTLRRPDLLKTKLFALCNRGTDLADCIAMAPTAAADHAGELVTTFTAVPCTR